MLSQGEQVGLDRMVSGRLIFRMMDTQGIDFDILQDMLRERGLGFYVPGLVVAALESGNYTPDSLLKFLYQRQGQTGISELDCKKILGWSWRNRDKVKETDATLLGGSQ